jgi:predicted DCC family thiol-disulfide oxidoreductase YuxK
MLEWDKQGVCRFAALQSPAGRALLQRCGRRPEDISSIVLVEEQQCYIK